MRKTLLQLHAYCGLACAVPLLAFGLSSLNFNHHFEWMKSSPEPVHWEADVKLPNLDSDHQIAKAVRDSLDIMGWAPGGSKNVQRGHFRFQLVHFGKEYSITSYPDSDRLDIVETGKGFWATFNSLHFLAEDVPNAPWYVNGWQYYQNFTVFFIFFSILSGIYLWFVSKQARGPGMAVLVVPLILSLALIVYLWLHG